MITGLQHAVLFCRDTDASRARYERAGFTYRRGYEGMHWLEMGDAEVMLRPGGEGEVRGRPVLHAAVSDAAAALARARANGLRPLDHQDPGRELTEPVRRPWGDVEFELQDPDGQWWAFTERP
jgi:catechol 2,3-dioxygenase-like lactoylglutathione lyase family enzyme